MTQTGVLINLSAKGVQNVYLDLAPQYTFFKRSFRRHTNYAVQAVMVSAANQIGFSRTITFPIPRNGDLLAETYFCAYLPCAGVDTTPNMYAKANRGVVTNKGLFGPAHNVMDSRLVNPTFSKWYGSKMGSSAAVNADGTIDGASGIAETSANVSANGSVGPFGAQSGKILRVKGKNQTTGGGTIGVPSRVASAPGCAEGLGASINTAADAQMAQQFLTGDDHANVGYVNALGHAMIQEAEFSVGGNSINKFSGEYMHIWHLMHNKSGDPSSDDNLFMYGDGVGAPMSENGSAAPHAIVEQQPTILNELSQYKLARFQLRLPKVDGAGPTNEPAYKKESYRLLMETGNQFPRSASDPDTDLSSVSAYTHDELRAIDEANSAALDGPTISDGQLMSLNFLREGDLAVKTPHYLTNAERNAASINTTYKAKIYKADGVTELPNAVAKCYLVGQGGTHFPVTHREVRTFGDLKGKLGPPFQAGESLEETDGAGWKKMQVAQLLPWSKDVLENSVTVGSEIPLDAHVSQQSSTSDLIDGKAGADICQEGLSASNPSNGCYAVSDQRYISGRVERREIIFGMGQTTCDMSGTANVIKDTTHSDIPPIFMQKAVGGVPTDYATSDSAAIVGKPLVSFTFGTYLKTQTALGVDTLQLRGDFFGKYEERAVSCDLDDGEAGTCKVVTESGFEHSTASDAKVGLANKNNVAAFYKMAERINQRFGKWFTASVEFSEKPIETTQTTSVEILRFNYGQQNLHDSVEKAIAQAAVGATVTAGQHLEAIVGAANATGIELKNRFTRYARLVFTGTELLRKTHGRLHITVGPIDDSRHAADANKGKGAPSTWLDGYNPVGAAPTRTRQVHATDAAPFVRYERMNSAVYNSNATQHGAREYTCPIFLEKNAQEESGVTIPTNEQCHRRNGLLTGTTHTVPDLITVDGKVGYKEPEGCGLIVTPSTGTPDLIPQKPSPDAIAFVVYNKIGPNERIVDTADPSNTAVESGALIKFEKVNTQNNKIGFNTTSDDLWVKTPSQTAPVPHSERMRRGVALSGLCNAVDGIPGAVNMDASFASSGSKGFVKDKYRNVIGDKAQITSAGLSTGALKAIPLLGPSFIKSDATCYLDPLSFYESCTGSMMQPLSSTTGVIGGAGYFGGAGTEWDDANAVFNSDSTKAGGSHQFMSFVGLCPDLQAGGSGTRRASDNQIGMGYDTALSSSSLGRVQNKALLNKTAVQTVNNAVSGTWANTETVEERAMEARKSTMTHLAASGAEAVRGWDKRHDISTAADTSNWKAVDHMGKRPWRTDYTTVASSEGAVAHKLRNDFVTTASHAAGTVSLSVGSKKAIRDGFAKRCHMSAVGNADHPEGTGRCVKVMVPLPFWYTRSGNKVSESGRTQVLPIIALQYHDCKVHIKLRSQTDIIQTDHEARNIGLRCTGMQGLNGSLLTGGAGAQTLDPTVATELSEMVKDSVLTTAAQNGGFAFSDKPTETRLTYQGNGVAYGTEIAAWGGPGKQGACCKNDAGDDILQAWRTGQSMQTDLGARSRAVPYVSGTAYPLTAPGDRGGLIDAYLLAQTIFLDSNERRLFASHTHEYLITQVQEQEFSVAPQTRPEFQMLTLSCKLNFNHPVSQMYWVCQRPESAATRNWFRYEATHMGGDDLMVKYALTLNSHDREDQEQSDAMFSRAIQPQTYMNTAPAGGASGTIRDPSEGGGKNIYMYSFAAHLRSGGRVAT